MQAEMQNDYQLWCDLSMGTINWYIIDNLFESGIHYGAIVQVFIQMLIPILAAESVYGRWRLFLKVGRSPNERQVNTS